MGRKKNGYIRESYESGIPGNGLHDTYVAMYTSMTSSRAFHALTGNQRELYRFCRAQKYNRDNRPGKVYPDWKECQFDTVFFMNWGIAKEIELYKSKNTFYKDLQRLIEIGFIECLYNGKTSRNKSVFKYSGKWRNYGSEK